MADTTASYNTGDTLRCTVTKLPSNAGASKTIERLMRLDPDNKRALDRAQKLRDQRKNVYVRGNRWWTSREKAARVVRAVEGASWNLPFTFLIKADLDSVAPFLSIEKA